MKIYQCPHCKKMIYNMIDKIMICPFCHEGMEVEKIMDLEKKNNLLDGLKEENNETLTENLARTFKSTKSSLVDLFSMGGAVRNREESEVISLFSKALSEDKLLALKCMFYLRDIRGGQGERKTFRLMYRYLAEINPKLAIANIAHVMYYGRWDDYFCLRGTRAEIAFLGLVLKQLEIDLVDMNSNKPISLLAKWLPSENASSKKTKEMARYIRHKLGYNSKEYRKILSKLRKHIKIVERSMCANEWNEIDYEKVPSRAAMIYRQAFKRHDEEGYEAYLESVEKGEKEIKASTLYPYDLVRAIAMKNKYDKTLDLQWKNQKDWKVENSLVVCDTSGSMGSFGSKGYRDPEPIYVSVGLALYFAERNEGAFHDHFITFSVRPELQEIIGDDIYTKLVNLSRAHWDGNTNFQAVFDLILRVAQKNNINNDDMVRKIYVISDMEFDMAGGHERYDWEIGRRTQPTNFEAIKQKYINAGYDMPMLVFWNVDSRQNNVPVMADERNVLLVSGSSPSIFKTLMSGKSYTPYDIMLETLNSERYDRIKLI